MARSGGGIPMRLTEHHKRLLRETTITPDQPGPILRDFQTLLDFIGSAGVPASGQYQLLPINALRSAGAIDA